MEFPMEDEEPGELVGGVTREELLELASPARSWRSSWEYQHSIEAFWNEDMAHHEEEEDEEDDEDHDTEIKFELYKAKFEGTVPNFMVIKYERDYSETWVAVLDYYLVSVRGEMVVDDWTGDLIYR